MSIAVVYGSTTGMTGEAAEQIASLLGAENIDVSGADATALAGYDALILGSSTWGAGDLQDDWDSFLPSLEGMDLSGKKVAVFGTGDHESFSDTFADALVTLRNAAVKAGAEMIGACEIEGYDDISSDVFENGKFIGLALDPTNQSELNDDRIKAWCEQLKSSL